MKIKSDITDSRELMESVMKEEIDYITRIDAETEEINTIVFNEDKEVLPPVRGNFSEATGQYIAKYVHPDDREYYREHMDLQHIRKELENRESVSIIYRLFCRKKYRRKRIDVYYHDEDQKQLIFVRRDMTESYKEAKRQKELLYEALTEARHACQEKSEFLGRMSHELRTPLNSIIGLTYLSRENSQNEKQLLANLDKIDKSAHFLLSFVDNIVNLSEIESADIELRREDTDFKRFLKELERMTRAMAHEKQIQFSMELRGNIEDEYRFDPEKLHKALFCILDNAVKFTKTEGRVDFIVELSDETETDAFFRFEIRDTGIGMNEDFIPHAFEPFEQDDNGNTVLYGGTGLGLAIARKIIRFVGGKIDVYSQKGRGSTFVVSLQLKRVKDCEGGPVKQKRQKDGEFDFSGKRVLLVEDDEINIEITKNILIHKRFEVEVAVNGRECLALFLNHEPGYYDVILMDIRMPVMDGLTATKRIRESEHEDSGRIPIVAMTANAFEEDVKKSFEAGMNAHLSKPVDIMQMYSTLDHIIFE